MGTPPVAAPPTPAFAGVVAAWVLLVLAVVVCVFVTSVGLKFAHQVTCAPSPPPVAFRQSIVFAGLGLDLVAAVAAVLRLRRGRVVAAMLLACAVIAVSFFTFLIPVFVASMC